MHMMRGSKVNISW